jgi:hypothetical protein
LSAALARRLLILRLILRRQRPYQNYRDHEHDHRHGRAHNVDPEEHPEAFDPSAVSPRGLELRFGHRAAANLRRKSAVRIPCTSTV